MSSNLSNRLILKKIYKMYLSDFKLRNKKGYRANNVYILIDCESVATELDMDKDILFGRLYYHLNKKHFFQESNGNSVELFLLDFKGDYHVIHFPLLSAILAEEEQSFLRFTIPLGLSLLALAISIFTLWVK